MTSGKVWASTGCVLGIGASLAANVADVVSRPHEPFGGVLAASWWPVALLVALEVLTRVSWPPGVWWLLTRWGGVGLVALIAALTSFAHMASLLTLYREPWLIAHLGPLSVDGLTVTSSAALLALGVKRRPKIGVVDG